MNDTKSLLSLLDLTCLDEQIPDTRIKALCQQAQSSLGSVAALCIPESSVKQAHTELANTNIQVCTVANFPSGKQPLETVLDSINSAFEQGADEIDIVIPYHDYLANQRAKAIHFMSMCRQAIPQHKIMKTILETGALKQPSLIAQASQDMIEIGADFLKTSTGKMTPGITTDAAAILLGVVAAQQYNVGVKLAGGIRTLDDAHRYTQLAQLILSQDSLSPTWFRMGSSSLVNHIA